MQTDGKVRRFEFRGYFRASPRMPVRGIAVGGRTGFGMAAALEDRSGRSWRYLPKHGGQV